jgi:hypothetical protein
VTIERPNVRALPLAAITQIGNQSFCYLVVNGKAVQTQVQIGVSDGSWVEVPGRLVRSTAAPEGVWQPFDGTEAVVNGNLSEISDGHPVEVDQSK